MKNLFIIDGASGTGKSDLVQFVEEYNIGVSMVKKYTTRTQRDYEKEKGWRLDLRFVSTEEFERLELDYQYRYGGYEYGFSRAALDDCFAWSDNVFVIVRDINVIKKLVADYSPIIDNVIPVFIYTDRDKIRQRLENQGVGEDRLQKRLERIEWPFGDYLSRPDAYREVLINNSDERAYRTLIRLMLDKYRPPADFDEKLVFVLMSFNPNNPRLRDYFSAMKRAVTRYDMKCINLHTIPGSVNISETTKKNIKNCRLAIVDLTENRPNVYYELGYVHAVGKKCIITAQDDTPPHFYPWGYKIVKYKSASELEDKLVEELEGVLSVSARATSKASEREASELKHSLKSRPIRILLLTANPLDTARLRLDKESRAIDQALRQAEFRDKFDLQQHWAVRITDLQGYLLRHKPDIVHFSGHGSGSSEIILEDSSGESQPVSVRALSKLFYVLRDNIRCVVLNACYSEQQARAIAEHIDCVIGMSKAIGDAAAISFAAAFYQALGYGRDVKTAFDLGCVQIDLEKLDEQDTPKLLAVKGNPEKIVFVHND